VRRETLTPRPDWRAKVEALGLDFHTSPSGDSGGASGADAGGEPYWWEAACYAFSSAEIDLIEEATDTLHQLCLEAVDRLVAAGDLDRLNIPEKFWEWVAQSWRRRDPDLYGRFDLAFAGGNPPKMLEYNADTPTALLEAAVVQWYWLEEVKPVPSNLPLLKLE
jgi:glutathionylspermidine synthase